jgi:hypothetical protein
LNVVTTVAPLTDIVRNVVGILPPRKFGTVGLLKNPPFTRRQAQDERRIMQNLWLFSFVPSPSKHTTDFFNSPCPYFLFDCESFAKNSPAFISPSFIRASSHGERSFPPKSAVEKNRSGA